MAANDFALQNGTEKIATNALTTMNGTNVTADLIEVALAKVVFGSDGSARHVDAANGLPVVTYNNSLVSTANSTATALALNAVFTGAAEDVSEYSLIFVTVFTDQISAIDGLRIQHSSNGTNWDMEDAFSIPASTGKTFSFGVQAKFFRIVYTNGATASTVMRLQTIYSKSAKKNSSVRPQDGRTNDNDMEEMLSYQMHYDAATNSWNKMRGTIASGLAVSGSWLNSGASTAAGNNHLTVGGSDGTNLRPLLVDTTGKLSVIGAFFQTTQPVSGAFFQATQPVSGTFFQATQPVSATALPLPTGASTETTLAALNTKVTAVNTGAVVISGALPAGANSIGTVVLTAETTKVIGTVNVSTGQTIAAVTAITNALPTGANTIGAVNIAAAQTLATVTTVAAVTAITNALPTGTNSIGTTQPPAITKGTQGTVGVTTQDLKDAGRNAIHYYTVIPVLSTATDTLQSLTGTKGGATVAATTTPAVVTTAKNFRVTRIAATYIATATSGYGIVRLRAQAAGVVTITSPVYATLALGSGAPTTANATDTEEATLNEAIEFAAGFGVGISVQGFAAATPTAVGYLLVSLTGYEY